MTDYPETLSTYVPNGVDRPDLLHAEVAASLPTLDGITVTPGLDSIVFRFTSALDAGEQATLASVCAAYANAPESPLAIDPLLADEDKGRDVTVVNYKSDLKGRLHKVITNRHRGEIREVDYYTDTTMTIKAIAVTVWQDAALTIPGYARSSNDLAEGRFTQRQWLREDGTVYAEKVTEKRYDHDQVEQMREGRRRRDNVIDFMIIEVLNMLVITEHAAANPMAPTPAEIAAAEADGVAFLETFSTRVSDFIRTGDLGWKTPPGSPNIQNDNTAWLDNTFDGSPTIQAIAAAKGWVGPTIRDEILAALVEVSAP